MSKYKAYHVYEYNHNDGRVDKNREFIGYTSAVSPAKARVNMEYRIYKKALYGGSLIHEMGKDEYAETYIEVEEVD